MTLKAGSIVYRVVEIDPPLDQPGQHSWKTHAAVIERAGARQLKLKAPFPGLHRTVFRPQALGHSFFETPLQAIRSFLTERRLEIESLIRRRAETERALAWALSQEGVIP